MQLIIVFVSMEAKFQSLWWGVPFQCDQKEKKLYAALRRNGKNPKRICFIVVHMIFDQKSLLWMRMNVLNVWMWMFNSIFSQDNWTVIRSEQSVSNKLVSNFDEQSHK